MKRSALFYLGYLGVALFAIAMAAGLEKAKAQGRSEGYDDGWDDGHDAGRLEVKLLAPQPVAGPRLVPDPTPAPGGVS